MTASDQERNDAYRAVGRYVVEFSRLIFCMRLDIERLLTRGGDPMIPALVLGESTASQIANAFFAVCRKVTWLQKQDEDVAQKLSNAVNEAIKTRNDFTHGDWWIGFGREPDGAMSDPTLWRTKPSRRAGPFEVRDIPVGELDGLSDALFELRQHVAEFGALCLGTHPLFRKFIPRVRDILVVREGRVVREGPRANEVRIQFS